ncbi:MAG TPA: single-stranded DNA-binding protein [Cellulomonas sp.]
MGTNELTLTLVGWVATEPKRYVGAGAIPFTSFRMASTRRYFDRAQNAWVDGRTEWFTIKAWRQQALNVAASLRKSDPLIVHGRLATEEWTGPEGPRTALVLEAFAIGPDLTFGESSFRRTVHLAGGEPPAQGTGHDDDAVDGELDGGELDGDELDEGRAEIDVAEREQAIT